MQRQLTVHNGVIFRGKHVIIPNVLQPEMLTRIHASHLGAEACFCKARDVISWPTMKPEVKDFVSNCIACNDYLQNSSKKPLISHPISSKPWSQKIATDIITVFSRNYLITVDLLRLLGIRHTAKQSNSYKCDFDAAKEISADMEYLMLLLLTLLYNLIGKSLSNLQKNRSLNAVHQIHIASQTEKLSQQ